PIIIPIPQLLILGDDRPLFTICQAIKIAVGQRRVAADETFLHVAEAIFIRIQPIITLNPQQVGLIGRQPVFVKRWGLQALQRLGQFAIGRQRFLVGLGGSLLVIKGGQGRAL